MTETTRSSVAWTAVTVVVIDTALGAGLAAAGSALVGSKNIQRNAAIGAAAGLGLASLAVGWDLARLNRKTREG